MFNKSTRRGIRLLLCLIFLIAPNALSALNQTGQEKTLGKWRDRLGDRWDFTLQLVQSGNEYTMIAVSNSDKSEVRRPLIEIAAGPGEVRRFQVKEGNGDMYVIRSDGHLGLYDYEGFIRIAQKIP